MGVWEWEEKLWSLIEFDTVGLEDAQVSCI